MARIVFGVSHLDARKRELDAKARAHVDNLRVPARLMREHGAFVFDRWNRARRFVVVGHSSDTGRRSTGYHGLLFRNVIHAAARVNRVVVTGGALRGARRVVVPPVDASQFDTERGIDSGKLFDGNLEHALAVRDEFAAVPSEEKLAIRRVPRTSAVGGEKPSRRALGRVRETRARETRRGRAHR